MKEDTTIIIKIGKMLFLLFFMSIIIFLFIRLLPSSPAESLLGAYNLPVTEENIKKLEIEWGLDKPLAIQYIRWISHFIKFDWGTSLITKNSIKNEMLLKLPYSFCIGLGGILLAAFMSFFIGYLASLKKNGFFDLLTKGLSIFSQTVPSFILSIVIIYYFSIKWKITNFFFGKELYNVFISIIIIALYLTGKFSRIVRIHFREQMTKTYILSAVSRGFPEKYILLKYGSKPVLYGLISSIISEFSWVIGGTAILEIIFIIPGISSFLVESIKYRDYNVIQSYIFIVAIWMTFVHIILDIILKFLDVSTKK